MRTIFILLFLIPLNGIGQVRSDIPVIPLHNIQIGLLDNDAFRTTMLKNDFVHYESDDDGEYWGWPNDIDSNYTVYFQKTTFDDLTSLIFYRCQKSKISFLYKTKLTDLVNSEYPQTGLENIVLDPGTKKERKSSQLYHYNKTRRYRCYIREDDSTFSIILAYVPNSVT